MPLRRASLRSLPVTLVVAGLFLAGCGGGAAPSADDAAGGTGTPPGMSAAESASASPTAVASASPSASAVQSLATAPAPDAFWAAVLQGAESAGHVSATGTGAGPAVVRFLADASEALVDGELVSRCVGGVAYAAGGAQLVPLDGAWTCGFAALVAGLRNTGQPIDSWSADFPTGEAQERIALEPGGRWRWELTGEGLDGGGAASLLVDAASGRLIEGRLSDEAGETVWIFDYDRAVAPIARP